MNFQIMQHAGGRKFIPALSECGQKPLIYRNAKRAAEVAADLTKLMGIKHQPRPVAEQNDWHKRELKRFKDGEYKHVVWIKEPWWKEIEGHFVHVGIKDKTRVAFTPDAEKGAADRQTAMLPGKYLQQFFGDILTKEQVRDYAMQHNTEFEQTELFFAMTPEEIQKAYEPSLGNSCFSGTTKANLYGSGDFAVAYIKSEAGRITARAVCAPERKIYVRPYGDYCRLESLLVKAGYRRTETGSDWVGLRVLKKWMWDGFYADWYGNNRNPRPDPDNKDYLIIK